MQRITLASVRRFVWLVCAGAVLLTPSPVRALQAPPASTADLREVVQVASGEAGTYLNIDSRLALGPRGNIFVAPTYDLASVAVFSPAGDYRLRFGTPGDGPGELAVAAGTSIQGLAVTQGGVVYVADVRRRVTAFTTEGGFLQSFPFPRAGLHHGLHAVDPGLMTEIGSHIVVMGEDGSLLREVPLPSGRGPALVQTFGDESFVAARRGASVLVWLAPDGAVRDSTVLTLPPGVADQTLEGPRILELHVDSSDAVWVLAYAERLDAPPVPAMSPAEIAAAGPVVGSPSVNFFKDRWLHLLYLVEGSQLSLAAAFDDLYLSQLLPGGRIVTLEEDDLGSITARVFEVMLRP